MAAVGIVSCDSKLTGRLRLTLMLPSDVAGFWNTGWLSGLGLARLAALGVARSFDIFMPPRFAAVLGRYSLSFRVSTCLLFGLFIDGSRLCSVAVRLIIVVSAWPLPKQTLLLLLDMDTIVARLLSSSDVMMRSM